MELGTSQILLLVFAALVVGLLAVVIDRLNFPQRKFRSKAVELSGPGPHRDRTGAHIIDLEDDEQ